MQLTFSQKQQVNNHKQQYHLDLEYPYIFLFQIYCHYHGKYFHNLFLMYDAEGKKIINVFHFQQHLHKIYRSDFPL